MTGLVGQNEPRSLGEKTVMRAFKRRHESPFMRSLARQVIRDLRLWRSIFGAKS